MLIRFQFNWRRLYKIFCLLFRSVCFTKRTIKKNFCLLFTGSTFSLTAENEHSEISDPQPNPPSQISKPSTLPSITYESGNSVDEFYPTQSSFLPCESAQNPGFQDTSISYDDYYLQNTQHSDLGSLGNSQSQQPQHFYSKEEDYSYCYYNNNYSYGYNPGVTREHSVRFSLVFLRFQFLTKNSKNYDWNSNFARFLNRWTADSLFVNKAKKWWEIQYSNFEFPAIFKALFTNKLSAVNWFKKRAKFESFFWDFYQKLKSEKN